MIQGLNTMGAAELNEVAKLAGVQPEKNLHATRAKILQWLGKTCAATSAEPQAVERATLEAVARNWGMKVEAGVPTDELEKSLRVKIASDAAEYLGPSWKLACVFAAAGPADAIAPKLKLLERAASLAVPSRKARQALMDEWRQNCKRWTNTADALAELKLHFPTQDRAELALNLALVVALADGRLSVEEERLYKELCEAAGKSATASNEMLRRVSGLFWDNQSKAAPKTASDDANADRIAALKAAELTLGTSGMLEGFVLEASDKLAGTTDAPAVVPKSGWQRVLGAFSGFSQYVSTKVSSAEQAVLTRIVYLSILRQHAFVVAELEAAEKAAAQIEREAAYKTVKMQVESEVGNATTAHAQRIIKLDP